MERERERALTCWFMPAAAPRAQSRSPTWTTEPQLLEPSPLPQGSALAGSLGLWVGLIGRGCCDRGAGQKVRVPEGPGRLWRGGRDPAQRLRTRSPLCGSGSSPWHSLCQGSEGPGLPELWLHQPGEDQSGPGGSPGPSQTRFCFPPREDVAVVTSARDAMAGKHWGTEQPADRKSVV